MRHPILIPFWERVKKHTRTQKISQERLAASIGIRYGTLKHWICYGLFPDIETAFDIAGVLGLSPEYLLSGIDKKAKKYKFKKGARRVTGKRHSA